jgi:hypothetical protein
VPTAVRPRAAIDLDLPLDRVGSLSPGWLDSATTDWVPGQLVFHDLRGDLPHGAYTAIESADTVQIGEVRLEPRVVDPQAGIWLFEVAPGP